MKRILYSLGLVALVCLAPALQSSAATQTVVLKPTEVELGFANVYLNGSPTPSIVAGGGASNLNNILNQDGQLAVLDPEIPGPGTLDPASNSVAVIDFEKNTICSAATVQSVVLHVIWAGEELPPDLKNNQAAIIKVFGSTSVPYFDAQLDLTGSEPVLEYDNEIFGGMVPPIVLDGGTFSGQIPPTLTEDSSATQIPMTLADLNDPSTRIVIAGGGGHAPEGQPEAFYTASVDYAYLEVAYDNSNCVPEGIDPSTISPPKTGALLTATIILTALIAGTASAIFGTRRAKLKHRASERE